MLSDLEASKYQHAEYRISIYGRKRVEWDILAAWICQNQLYSDNVVWLIQARPLSARQLCKLTASRRRMPLEADADMRNAGACM